MINVSDRTSRAHTPVPEDLRPFAIETINTVIKISKKFDESNPFCTTLCGVLWSIMTELQKQHQDYNTTQSKKVESLLNNLERLCSWPPPTKGRYSDRWSTLKALKHPFWRKKAAGCLHNFATDKSLAKTRADIIGKLQKFSARRLNNETAEMIQTTNVWTDRGPPYVRQKLEDDMQLLYATLQQYRSCKAGGLEHDIMVNIRLNGYRTLGENNDSASITVDNATAEFGVLFLNHPHVGKGCWQETCVQICHTRSSKVVKFPGLSPNLATAQRQRQYEYIAHENFCQKISYPNHDLLCLSVRDGKFVYHERSDATRDWLASCEAVSLTSAFTKPELYLDAKSKAILQMLLAKATWEFYDSDAIGQGLTSDKIHFICEKRNHATGAFVNEPVLLTRFAENESQVNEIDKNTPSAEMIHKMPKILALGIMLLEIETGKSIKNHRGNPGVCPSPPFNINTDYYIACNLIATGQNAPSESIISDINMLSPLRAILPLCIKRGELETELQQSLSAQKKSTSNIDHSNELRSFIYNRIVLPLENLANTYEKHSRVKAMWKVRERQEIPRNMLPLTGLQPGSQHGSSLGNSGYSLREDSRMWFKRYELLMDHLQPGDMEIGDTYKRIKIAILDTGIAQGDYDYLRDSYTDSSPSPEYEYKDFVSNSAKDTACDESGHGSAGVSLLLRMCPSASLYIARVLETGVAVKDDVERVVQGIDWAIEKQVDIITMALGFERAQQRVIDAIDRAYRRGILIFAAASNGRNFGPVYCPAILTDQVFGIFSTDAGIRESRSLNPSPIGGDNFAIFGEDVELSEGGSLVQGTSYSTSIAAGLAAMLLDFVCQEAGIHTIRELSNLKSKQGMKMIFREMAKSDNGYLCIRPWKLLRNDLDSENHIEGDHVRSQEREWIRGTIARLLRLEKLHDS